MNKVLLSSKKMDYCIPQWLFDALNEELSFGLDAAASADNAKCKEYFTESDNALTQDWGGRGAVFCNPPYGRQTSAFVEKAYRESLKGTTVVLLIPARTDTRYFHDFILGKAEIRFIRGRLKFTDSDGTAYPSAPFPSMIVVFRGAKTQNSNEGGNQD